MEAIIKKELGTNVFRPFGSGGGGTINDGHGYLLDGGQKVFVKFNFKPEVRHSEQHYLQVCPYSATSKFALQSMSDIFVILFR